MNKFQVGDYFIVDYRHHSVACWQIESMNGSMCQLIAHRWDGTIAATTGRIEDDWIKCPEILLIINGIKPNG